VRFVGQRQEKCKKLGEKNEKSAQLFGDSNSGLLAVDQVRSDGSATLMRGKSRTCRRRVAFFSRVSDPIHGRRTTESKRTLRQVIDLPRSSAAEPIPRNHLARRKSAPLQPRP
jgi:hypothetical protein